MHHSKDSPAAHTRMDTSLWATYFSCRTAHDNAYVKRPEALLRIVFDVTEVMCKLVLNVSCARNHSGATCQKTQETFLFAAEHSFNVKSTKTCLQDKK